MNRLVLGLDLGMRRDYTALAACECYHRPTGRDPVTYQTLYREGAALRGLERMKLGLGYLAVPVWVRGHLRRWRITGGPLVVDATGVGAPVVELLRREHLPCSIVPVTITASGPAHADATGWKVSRTELLTRLATGLESQRVRIAAGLGEAAALRKEMLALRPRGTTHDDLTLAFALAWWYAEKQSQPIQGSRPLGIEY